MNDFAFGLATDLTREQWLRKASASIQGWLTAATGNLQPDVHVSVGFTGTGTRCQLDKVLGACWTAEYQTDGKPHIFISPVVNGVPWEQHGVLHVLAHELCHAAAREGGHGKAFQCNARALGLMAPWRTTPTMTIELHDRLVALSQQLGIWPHEPLRLFRLPVERKQAELLAGNDISYEARIIIPSETKDNRPLPDHFIADILVEIAKLFGGFTDWQANGGYIMADGKLKTERVCVVDIATQKGKTTREHLEQLARDIHAQGQQETVYLRLPGGRVELI